MPYSAAWTRNIGDRQLGTLLQDIAQGTSDRDLPLPLIHDLYFDRQGLAAHTARPLFNDIGDTHLIVARSARFAFDLAGTQQLFQRGGRDGYTLDLTTGDLSGTFAGTL